MRRPQRRDDRGAVAPFIAAMMVVLIVSAAFAVDLGMQRVVRRDLQALADVVALDLARRIDGRPEAELLAEADLGNPASALSRSLARNADVLGDAPQVTVDFGSWDGAAWNTTASPPTAVKVTAAGAVDFAFSSGRGAATRVAIATNKDSACFTVGSYAARLRTADASLLSALVAPLNDIVQPQGNLDALSYRGLANAVVTLDDLAATSDLGTVDDVLTGYVTAGNLVRATIAVLRRDATGNAVAITALGRVLAGQGDLDTPVLLSNMLRVSPDDDAALAARLNVLDLVVGSLLLADGGHAIDLGNLSAGTGNLHPVGDASLQVVEGPRQACGSFGSPQATARTSQLAGTATMALQLPSINGITGATGVVQTPEADVTITVNLGNATATLAADPTCASGTLADPDLVPVRVQSGLATLRVTTDLHFEARISVLGLGLVTVLFDQVATAQLPMPDAATTATLRVPPHDSTPLEVGSTAALGDFTIGSSATVVEARVGGVPITDLARLTLVRAALAPVSAQLATNASVTLPLGELVDSLNAHLVPLQRLLGLNVSGADLVAMGRPVCGMPVLRS